MKLSPGQEVRKDMSEESFVLAVFSSCASAIRAGKLVHRESRHDKEYHFQNWMRDRIGETGLNYEAGGRNSFPDFRMVHSAEGYEVKGLAYPGREVNYDCNSQAPAGYHNGRTIYYVFGRYPAVPDGDSYPILGLVICHGDFLNADHEYVHRNKSLRGFGSYGDIMIRDRKMYVAPTPFGLVSGVAHNQTLILPQGLHVRRGFKAVGTLIRREAECLIVGYSFDLKSNTLLPKTMPNPSSGREHAFNAWRLENASGEPVSMREPSSGLEADG